MWLIIVIILVAVFYFTSKANKESRILNSTPFIHAYPVVVSGINEYLFNGEAEFESKDAREHYLFKNSLGKECYVQFIYRENTIYLKYFENLMDIKTTFSFQYSGIKGINGEKQHFIAQDFCQRVKTNSKVTF